MMVQVQVLYDTDADQIVYRTVAAEGEGDVELLRLDVAGLSPDDRRRLRHVRDPDRPVPEPGAQAATRRG